MGMIKRKVTLYQMPLPEGVEILKPEDAVLKFDDAVTVDVGVICYLMRNFPPERARLVDAKSFSKGRVKYVLRIIMYASDLAASSGLRGRTLYSRINRLMAFLHWSDERKKGDILVDKERARGCFEHYVDHIRDRYSRGDMSQNAAAQQLASVAKALGDLFGDEKFSRGINLLRSDPNTREVTTPPDMTDQSHVLALSEAVFFGLSDLVLNFREFPYALSLPGYLNFKNNVLWLFPSTEFFRTPFTLKNKPRSTGFDYREGLLATKDQLSKEYGVRDVYNILWGAEKQLRVANFDRYSPSRIKLASSAINVYVLIFFAETGMSGSELAGIPWGGSFEIKIIRQGFRTIKWRADGREGFFELPVSGMKRFHRFLELREYLLKDEGFGYLFFRKHSLGKKPSIYDPSTIGTYYFLRRIDPNIVSITSRKWRAAKSDWLLRNTDPSTTALILQNSERTVLRNYAEGSESLCQEEMGTVLARLASSALSREQRNTASGNSCAEYGRPLPIASLTRVEPNCDAIEGCLFCAKFQVHADETDIRKLASCRYVLNMMRPASGSYEDFESLLRPMLDRIDFILAEISEVHPDLVVRITREVEVEGELSSYWSHKAQMLLELGI